MVSFHAMASARPPFRAFGVVLAALLLASGGGGLVRAQSDDEQPPTEATSTGATPEAATPTPVPGSRLETSASFPIGFLAADSELVYGPTLFGFDTAAFVTRQGGYLAAVREIHGDTVLTGPEIIDRVAVRYSVGPRVLLALIETMSGWVTNSAPADRTYPLGGSIPGLSASVEAAADSLNDAYYRFKLDGDVLITLADGTVVAVPSVNPGSFAVLAFLGADTSGAEWPGLELPSQYVLAWERLFGAPATYDTAFNRPAMGPGPRLAMPFPAGELWYYVAGPHPPAGNSSPWSAVDFAPPPPEATGCAPSPSWVTAAAGGDVEASEADGLLVDTDEDGFIGTGWVHVYTNLSALERAPAGRGVRRGAPLGHPWCDGGARAPARVSFSRRFDGEWIAATDPRERMDLAGWFPLPSSAPGAGRLADLSAGSGLPPRVPGSAKVGATNGVIVRP
jgi:hypothetical protein